MESFHLLIIEHDPTLRGAIQQTLEDHFGPGKVTAVAGAQQALELELNRFELILCDYELPDSNGIQLLEEIRRRCTTPVIMVTGQNCSHFAAEAIRKGATDYVVKYGDYLFTVPLVVEKNLIVSKVRRENEALHEELERALEELQCKNAQLQKSLDMVEKMAATDPLTGLYNRRHFSRVLEQLFAESDRADNDLSCVMIDLDGYKGLNDTHGHLVGDQLLTLAGKVIQANMRKMDVAARYGGDEFVLLLPHASAEEAAGVVRRISDEYRHGSGLVLGRTRGVTMSMGIASRRGSRPAGGDPLVAQADAALYRAKAAWRNCVVTYSPELQPT